MTAVIRFFKAAYGSIASKPATSVPVSNNMLDVNGTDNMLDVDGNNMVEV